MTQVTKHNPAQKPAVIESELPAVIYADRIINAGFGPGVSRLTLAVEKDHGTLVVTNTLVLPTPALLEAMTQVMSAFSDNEEVRNKMIAALDAFKAQLDTTGK